ncbi:MAG: hypothetical protein RIR05_440 [Bacteroidota bacterium]
MQFNVSHTDIHSKARCGELETAHGTIQTPVFMTVGTQGTVKGIHQYELKNIVNAPILLGNTYHLYLRPGTSVLNAAGGLHKFMNWNGPILTDSGGYQIFSLAQHRKITESGAVFKSHIDGSRHELTPELAIDIQRIIGGDIIMAFDECLPYPSSESETEHSMHLTHRWLERCISRFSETQSVYGYSQALFPIVQGGTSLKWRTYSAQFASALDQAGYAIGGLSVGEPSALLYDLTDTVTALLPENKPRYLMGVGTPENVLECIARGVDMMDCVLPARNARHGLLYTYSGMLHIKNEKWKHDFSPLDASDPESPISGYSKSYIRHLFAAGERLGPQIASLHNLRFYQRLTADARQHIANGTFTSWKTQMVEILNQKL